MKLQAVYLEDNTGNEVTIDVPKMFLWKDINTGDYPVNESTFDHLMTELEESNMLNVWTYKFANGQVDTLKGPLDLNNGQREAIRLIKDGEVVWEKREHDTPSN